MSCGATRVRLTVANKNEDFRTFKNEYIKVGVGTSRVLEIKKTVNHC